MKPDEARERIWLIPTQVFALLIVTRCLLIVAIALPIHAGADQLWVELYSPKFFPTASSIHINLREMK
jgi:hypothetical protein